MTFFRFFLLFFLLAQLPLNAKNLGVSISYARFMAQDNQPYVELYFALNSQSLRFKPQPNGKYRAALDVLVTFSKDAQIAAATKFRIKSALVEDTLLIAPVLLHQERIALENGQYLMFMELIDAHDTSQSYPVEQKIKIDFSSSALSSSDLVLLERFEAATVPGAFTKSGYNLFPIITSGITYLPPSFNQLHFYAELYRTAEVLGENTSYAYQYFLINAKTQEKLRDYGRIKKVKTSKVHPVLHSIALDKLSTGTYELVVQVLNSKGEVVHEKNTLFIKEANPKPLEEILASATGNPSNFASKIGQVDTLYEYLNYLTVIGNEAEKKTIKEVQQRRDQEEMQNYLYGFWEQKFPAQAEEIWKRYLNVVVYANKEFGTRIQKGYLTDRGYAYLVYGAPAQMEDRKMEPTLPPYQIWHYHNINTPWAIRQTNRIFVFAEFQHSSNDYELIHSTAIGELKNHRWRYQLANGKLGGGSNIDNGQLEMGDEFGSRLNNNTLIMDRGN